MTARHARRPRHARRVRLRRTSGRRRALVVAAVTGAILAGALPAYAYWTTSGTGDYSQARADSLPAADLTADAVTARTVDLSWTQPFSPTSYALAQSPGTLAGCPAGPGTATAGCTAAGLTPNTSYTWTLAASLHSWASTATVTASTDRQATTTTLRGLTPTSGPTGTTFSATAAVSGDEGYGTPAGTVVLALYPTADCSGAASYATAPQPLSGGGATAGLQPAVGSYHWQATYTPGDTVNLASTSACSAAVTVTAGATYLGVGTPVTVTRTERNASVPYPAGTSPGDLVLLVVVSSESRNATIGSPGWDQLPRPRLGRNRMGLQAFWHVAGAESAVTVSRFRATAAGATAWVLAYTDAGTPAVAGVSSGTSASASELTPRSVTTTATSTTVISFVGINASRRLSVTAAQGFTTRASLTAAAPVPGRALGVADRYAATAGPVLAPTWGQGVGLSGWAYVTAAFSS